jgi:RNA polymerase sigma factor (sigma-70 family)
MKLPISDRHLVDAVVTGDSEAAALFVERFHRFIFAVAAGHAPRSGSAAHNVVQNVIGRLWEDDFRRLRTWRGEGSFAPYLASIVKRALLDYARSPWARRVVARGLPDAYGWGPGPAGPPDDDGDAHRELLAKERRIALLSAMKRLGARDRDLLDRRWFREEPVAEIAEALGIEENAVHQALHRAHRNLRARLREGTPDHFSGRHGA